MLIHAFVSYAGISWSSPFGDNYSEMIDSFSMIVTYRQYSMFEGNVKVLHVFIFIFNCLTILDFIGQSELGFMVTR